MKSRLLVGLIMTFFTMAWSNTDANAQITGVTIDSFSSYSQSYCSVPAVAFLNVGGHIIGSTTTNDSVTIYANYGDGNDTTFKTPVGQNYFWGWWQHTYQTTGTYSVMFVVTTSNNIVDTVYTPPYTYSNACASVAGTLYVDANSNCIKDAGEQTIWGTVALTNTSTSAVYYAWANANGAYSATVPTGTYSVAPFASWMSGSVTVSCPVGGSATVNVMSGTTTQNFGFSCSLTPATTDVTVQGWSPNWRPGFNRPLALHVNSNALCINTPGTLTVTLDPLLSYAFTTGSNPAPTVSGSTLTWNIANLNMINDFYTQVMIHCSSTANLGDTLCVTAVITPATPDANTANNTIQICAPVNNSYDPNDKIPSPRGTGPAGNIKNGTEITYVVNFQNTGNDVAYDITIADTLDSDLNIGTFRLLHSTHMVVPHILPGNILKFRFDGINLPDSNSNEPASHGHIIYTVSPKPNLALGTQIKNTAHIYFDYNSAIVTNTTLNTIAAPQGIQHISNGELKASVFPNPANNNIYIEVSEKGNFRAELYDMMGRVARSTQSTNGNTVLNVKDVPAGMYLLRLSNAENKVLSTKINVQH
jgi:uncharacterized repeat protein (TIGR01451 family)